MYSLNKLKRNVLITFEEVMFHAPTKHTLDERLISQSIIVAEERFLRTELCYDFYEALINSKNVLITEDNKDQYQTDIIAATPEDDPLGPIEIKVGDILNASEFLSIVNQELWNKYLWKITAEAIVISAYPDAYVQLGSEGALHTVSPAGLQQTSGFVLPLLTSIKWAIDKKIQDRLGPLLDSMKQYLCRNKTSFPTYCKEKCPCDDETTNSKNAGVALDAYNDHEWGRPRNLRDACNNDC